MDPVLGKSCILTLHTLVHAVPACITQQAEPLMQYLEQCLCAISACPEPHTLQTVAESIAKVACELALDHADLVRAVLLRLQVPILHLWTESSVDLPPSIVQIERLLVRLTMPCVYPVPARMPKWAYELLAVLLRNFSSDGASAGSTHYAQAAGARLAQDASGVHGRPTYDSFVYCDLVSCLMAHSWWHDETRATAATNDTVVPIMRSKRRRVLSDDASSSDSAMPTSPSAFIRADRCLAGKLQILARLFSRYAKWTSRLSETECTALVNALLQHADAAGNSSWTLTWCCRVASAVAAAATDAPIRRAPWRRVWDMAVYGTLSDRARHDGLALMAQLLRTHLVVPVDVLGRPEDVLRLLATDSSKAMRPSAELLLAVAHAGGLSWPCAIPRVDEFRGVVLRWLLPQDANTANVGNTSLFARGPVYARPGAWLVAECVFAVSHAGLLPAPTLVSGTDTLGPAWDPVLDEDAERWSAHERALEYTLYRIESLRAGALELCTTTDAGEAAHSEPQSMPLCVPTDPAPSPMQSVVLPVGFEHLNGQCARLLAALAAKTTSDNTGTASAMVRLAAATICIGFNVIYLTRDSTVNGDARDCLRQRLKELFDALVARMERSFDPMTAPLAALEEIGLQQLEPLSSLHCTGAILHHVRFHANEALRAYLDAVVGPAFAPSIVRLCTVLADGYTRVLREPRATVRTNEHGTDGEMTAASRSASDHRVRATSFDDAALTDVLPNSRSMAHAIRIRHVLDRWLHTFATVCTESVARSLPASRLPAKSTPLSLLSILCGPMLPQGCRWSTPAIDVLQGLADAMASSELAGLECVCVAVLRRLAGMIAARTVRVVLSREHVLLLSPAAPVSRDDDDSSRSHDYAAASLVNHLLSVFAQRLHDRGRALPCSVRLAYVQTLGVLLAHSTYDGTAVAPTNAGLGATAIRDELLSLLADDAFEVRLAAARTLPLLPASLGPDHCALYAAIVARLDAQERCSCLPQADGALEATGEPFDGDAYGCAMVTELVALAHVAVTAPDCELASVCRALYRVARHEQRSARGHGTAALYRMLCALARRTGYADSSDLDTRADQQRSATQRYMLDLLPSIVAVFAGISQPCGDATLNTLSVGELPYGAFGFATARDFAAASCSDLLPLLHVYRRSTDLAYLAEQLHCTTRDLLQRHMDRVLAMELLLLLPPDPQPEGAIRRLAESIARSAAPTSPKVDPDELVKHRLEPVMSAMMEMLCTEVGSAVQPSGFDEARVMAALAYLARVCTRSSVAALLTDDPRRTRRLSLCVRMRIFQAVRMAHKHRALVVYGFLHDLLIASKPDVCLLRELMFTLYHCARWPALRATAVAILCRVCDAALECRTPDDPRLLELAYWLPMAVTLLLDGAATEMRVMRRILESEHPMLRQAVDGLRIVFGTCSALTCRRPNIGTGTGTDTMGPTESGRDMDDLDRFAELLTGPSAACVRPQGLQYLRDVLATSLRRADRRQVARLVHALIVLMRRSPNDEVMVRACQDCLGEIGPLDLDVYALDAIGGMQVPLSSGNIGLSMSQLLRVSQVIDRPGTYAGAADPLLTNSHRTARNATLLELVDQFLVRDDMVCVAAAARALERLSQLPDYPAARGIALAARGYLPAYSPPSDGTPNPAPPGAGQQRDAADADAVAWLDRRAWVVSPSTRADQAAAHAAWLRPLCRSLVRSAAVRDAFWAPLDELCALSTEFCEHIFGAALESALCAPAGVDQYDSVASHMNDFLTNHQQVPVASVRVVIAALAVLQTRRHPLMRSINYVTAAVAALACQAPFSALYFAEIWCGDNASDGADADVADGGWLFSPAAADRAQSLVSMLVEAYGQIGEPDGLSALSRPLDAMSQVWLHELDGNWARVLGIYDAHVSCVPGSESLMPRIAQCLRRLGLGHVLETYVRGLSGAQMRDAQAESAWRATQWSGPSNAPAACAVQLVADGPASECGFHTHVCRSLAGLAAANQAVFSRALAALRGSVLADLQSSSLESARGLAQPLMRLQCALELSEAWAARDAGDVDRLAARWSDRVLGAQDNFDTAETVLALRLVLLRSLQPARISDDPAIAQHLQMYASLARRAHRHQAAASALQALQQHCPATGAAVDWRMDYAELLWAQADHVAARGVLASLLPELRGATRTRALRRYGEWLAEMRSDSYQRIIGDYLRPVVLASETHEERAEAYHVLAKYADAQYSLLSTTACPPGAYGDWSDIGPVPTASGTHCTSAAAAGDAGSHEAPRALARADTAERTCPTQGTDPLLQLALSSYARCADTYELVVYRIVALWFSKCDEDWVSALLERELRAQPPRLLLPLLYQLAARLGYRTNSQFAGVLERTLLRMAAAHPHQVLFVLLALDGYNLDDTYTATASACRATTADATGHQAKCTAARAILQTLSESGAAPGDSAGACLAAIVREMRWLQRAYCELANLSVGEPAARSAVRGRRPMPPHLQLSQRVPLMHVQVPTATAADGIAGFEAHFELVGGLHAPKMVLCRGTSGRVYRQLVKGSDDPRQDAVMQQVFSAANRMLALAPTTARRRLRMRTYRVIPLSQRTGVLEWVTNAVPMGDYLIGPDGQGAHARYRPTDWPNAECRQRLGAVQGRPSRVLREAYDAIAAHFRPVFRHFFLERFPAPAAWFEHRLAYARSLAVASMVGYVVGLGDRHVYNILLDQDTAELVHIDFGVAFEQGKRLPIPECVPFRLTRDLVDGLGVTGVEGTYRRCCEEVMRVMREQSATILTIIEVLLHDPLYRWTMDERKAERLQQAGPPQSRPGRREAELVLHRLRQKLDGIEEGAALGVEGQVDHLIREARSADRLSQLFAGWQPWI